jgi:GNAT superfamily N-acetyltransferase
VSRIRPLEPGDVPALARLYSEFGEIDVAATPKLEPFFQRLMFDDPFLDPEIPALAYEDPDDGVVGVRCVHPRRFAYGDRAIRIASAGPMMVDRRHRRRGIAAKLVERYFEGAQELAASDRSGDIVHGVWKRLGTLPYPSGSVGWAYALAPAGRAAGALAREHGRERLPGQGLLAALDAPLRKRRTPEPASGSVEPLADAAVIELLAGLGDEFALRPAYTEEYLAWLFPTMELVNVGEQLVRRLVRAGDGRAIGAYVMYVTPGAAANVVQLAAARDDVALVLDHLIHDAAARGVAEVEGRLEPHLLESLRAFPCRVEWVERANVQSADPELIATVLGGRSLLTRMDGEYWMRPRVPVAAG